MKISIDANEANVKKRVGSGQYTFNLLREWSMLDKDEFDLYLKDKPQDDLPKASTNWRYHVVRPKKAWLSISLPLHLMFSSMKSDVYFAPAHYSPPITSGCLVVTIHDLAYKLFPELFLRQDLYKLNEWTKSSLKRAHRVIAVSHATKKDIIKYYDVNESKIVVVHNGYDSKMFNSKVKSNKNIFKKYEIPDNNYILYVGTIQPRKNIIKLVQAFHLLKEEGYKGKLVIAGNPGWMAEETMSSIHESKYSNEIVLTGYVEQDDLPSFYKNADVYALPSLMEGFGIPLLESMAVGTPVVAANNSSLPEVVGKAGNLFNPTDPVDIKESILNILKNRSKYSKLSLLQARKFSWKKAADETLEVFKTLPGLKS